MTKMNTKKILTSFAFIASILFLASVISAADFSGVMVTIDDITADDASVIAGELITVKVYFNSNTFESNIKVKAEIEGEKLDVDEITTSFDVEPGRTYKKSLVLKVPNELKNDISDDAELNIKIYGGDSQTFEDTFTIRIQRASYDVGFMSVSTSQTIEAGKLFPIDIVLKNTGYNDLDDLYVTVSIPELNAKKSAYFGDLISVEDDDNDDTLRGRIFLQLPFSAKQGTYSLNVEARNSDLNLNKVEEIFITNAFSSNIIVDGNELLILNPTNNLMALRLVPETSEDVAVTLSQDIIVIPAGGSKSITVSASTDEAGTQGYTINVFSLNGELVDTITLSKTIEQGASNAVAVLAVVLTIIFLVLLAALIVLVTRKPAKTEEFGESYY